MQTHEWEALLDGTTPGLWEAREDHGGMNLFAGSERVFGSDSCGDVYGAEEDVRLAAAAPEAVAEVIRLRKAIEDAIRSLRAPLCSHMPEGDELDEYLEEWEMQGYAAHILTCILEGDNHA